MHDLTCKHEFLAGHKQKYKLYANFSVKLWLSLHCHDIFNHNLFL